MNTPADLDASPVMGPTEGTSRANSDSRHRLPAMPVSQEHVGEIRFAYLAAQRAGPIVEPVVLLKNDELYAPVNCNDDDDTFSHPSNSELSICGYQIVREISTGGQATVYEAVHEVTGQRVAVKVIAGGRFAGSTHKARFEQEVQFLASLNHANIVGIIDRGRTADGSWFMTMRYIEGCSLQEFWSKKLNGSAQGARELLEVFYAIASAIGEAHRNNIVHRDLKPANIRVDERSNPFILDFGLARALSTCEENSFASRRDLTECGQVMGSLRWNSPEQAAGQQVGAPTDVYAIGVMLYQAISGEFPYRVDGTIRELLDDIAQAVPPKPSWQATCRRCTNPDALDRIIAKCLQKLPEDRYANAGELATDLKCLLQGMPVNARNFRRSQRRRFRFLPVAALAPVIILGCWHWMTRKASGGIPVTVFELPSIENSLKMRFVRLPAGSFFMGSPDTESGRDRDEAIHRVTITKPYYIDITEVTRAQFQKVMDPSNLRKAADAELPVTNVSWNQAVDFCRRLSALDGRTYRLPTEAEWEFACRGGTRGQYGGTTVLDEMGWYQDNSSGHLHNVAQLHPNQYGIFDMHGNAAEWVEDAYQEYGDRPVSDPLAVNNFQTRGVRGGSFSLGVQDCRSARRDGRYAGAPFADVGFRIVAP